MSIHKLILPLMYDYGEPAVLIVGVNSKRLNKTAMQKRAAAFDDVIALLKPRPDRAYLHVITTGEGLLYGPNQNGDFWVGYAHLHVAPFPKSASSRVIMLDGGLRKYHDDTYMKTAKVYQEHKTLRDGALPSGLVVAARYNGLMKRGLLLIAVDVLKWEPRLNKKAKGLDIFLSIGADVPYDQCSICHNKAHNVSEYCGHIKKAKLQIDQDGNQVCMLNDAPKFYDISGVNVPADKMAYVIRKVASGASTDGLYKQASMLVGRRKPMPLTKAAGLLSKLSKLQKRIVCKLLDDASFADSKDDKDRFISLVEFYPVDLIISGCNRKGILLSPDMLFRLMGKLTSDPLQFISVANHCCADCSNLFLDMLNDLDFRQDLMDGEFDTIAPADLNLLNILSKFVPTFGVTPSAIGQKTITIVVRGDLDKVKHISGKLQLAIQEVISLLGRGSDSLLELPILKKAAMVLDAFKRTYARYVLSFAAQNNDLTCRFALLKIARYNKVLMC